MQLWTCMPAPAAVVSKCTCITRPHVVSNRAVEAIEQKRLLPLVAAMHVCANADSAGALPPAVLSGSQAVALPSSWWTMCSLTNGG